MIRLLFVQLVFLFNFSSCSSEQKNIVKVESNSQSVVSNEKTSGNDVQPDGELETAVAGRAASKSVTDYYLLLPDEYFGEVPNDSKARRSYIKIEDAKNGYLKIEKPYALEDVSKTPKEDRELVRGENAAAKGRAAMEIALFKQKQGRNVIVVSSAAAVNNPFEVIFKLDFWEDDNGVLTDVTEKHSAKIDYNMAFAELRRQLKPTDEGLQSETAENIEHSLHPELPRYGKAIKIIVNPNFAKRRIELLNLIWNGEEFVCEPARKK